MSTSETGCSDTALALRQAHELGLNEPSDEDEHPPRADDNEDRRSTKRTPEHAQLSDEVIGLREWATGQTFPLRAPRDSRREARPTTNALVVSQGMLAPVANTVELAYEEHSWRVRDWSGVANLKQDGQASRDITLLPGTELTILGKTFVAESARSIALRNFCTRLVGWRSDRLAVVDEMLRAIRLAAAGRAALVLCGSGDLVAIAYAIHRYSRARNSPFIVSDPRRRHTAASVRSPANCPSGMEAIQKALRGTLCVRARRLPRDFADVVHAIRHPESEVQLTVCGGDSRMVARSILAFGALVVEIPSLDTRRADVPRIVREYAEDVLDAFGAPHDCLSQDDIEWIIERAALTEHIAIPDIEKAVIRVAALRLTKDLTRAASLVGMARVSLERWLRRRDLTEDIDIDGHDIDGHVHVPGEPWEGDTQEMDPDDL